MVKKYLQIALNRNFAVSTSDRLPISQHCTIHNAYNLKGEDGFWSLLASETSTLEWRQSSKSLSCLSLPECSLRVRVSISESGSGLNLRAWVSFFGFGFRSSGLGISRSGVSIHGYQSRTRISVFELGYQWRGLGFNLRFGCGLVLIFTNLCVVSGCHM